MAIQPNGRRVLVVEDSDVIRRVLSLILQGEGYQVAQAEGGRTALALARQYRPDVVTLDLSLPDLDGREVLRLLKEDPLTRAIPVVVISANPELLTEPERSHAAQVIHKPFDVDDLLAGVSRAAGHPAVSLRGERRRWN
jgi:CheY-like chemotaxis protein